MSQTLRKKIICLLATAAMLVCGMCLEVPRTDSWSVCPQSSVNSSAMLLLAQDTPAHLPDSCTLRMLGHGNSTAASDSTRRQYGKCFGRNLILSVLSDLFSARQDTFLKTGVLLPAATAASHYHIIQFIHHGDGAK